MLHPLQDNDPNSGKTNSGQVSVSCPLSQERCGYTLGESGNRLIVGRGIWSRDAEQLQLLYQEALRSRHGAPSQEKTKIDGGYLRAATVRFLGRTLILVTRSFHCGTQFLLTAKWRVDLAKRYISVP